YGSIFRFEGQASVFDARKGPCYRCLYAEPPPPGLVPSCAEGGVLGVLPGIVGPIQAIEALKVLLGKEDTLIGRLLVFESPRHEIVVYCKTRVRSGRITNFLRDLGFRKVKNLVGGIDEWAEKVEPEMPRY